MRFTVEGYPGFFKITTQLTITRVQHVARVEAMKFA